MQKSTYRALHSIPAIYVKFKLSGERGEKGRFTEEQGYSFTLVNLCDKPLLTFLTPIPLDSPSPGLCCG